MNCNCSECNSEQADRFPDSPQPEEVCEWTLLDDDSIFGRSWNTCIEEQIWGKVRVEKFTYCPYCGKKIKVIE